MRRRRRGAPAPAPRTFFTSPVPADQMKGKQAVVETSAGPIVMDLLPEAAPNHVMNVVEQIEGVAVNGEAPVERIEIRHVQVEKVRR